MINLITVNQRIENIKKLEDSIKGSFYNIALEISEVKKEKSYEQLGYKNIVEFGEKELGYKKTMIYGMLKIGELNNSDALENKSFRELLKMTEQEKVEEEDEDLKAIKIEIKAIEEEEHNKAIDTFVDLYKTYIKIRTALYEMRGHTEEEKREDTLNNLREERKVSLAKEVETTRENVINKNIDKFETKNYKEIIEKIEVAPKWFLNSYEVYISMVKNNIL
ncbi:MAG: hypothetical protein ACRC0V_09045 [Fusobacteriaceae bacterium]